MAPEKDEFWFWYMTLLFSFEGRIRRYDWWVYFTAPVLLIFGLFELLNTVSGVRYMGEGYGSTAIPVDVFRQVFALVVALPTLAVNTKRLHDRNRSGWLQALPLFLGVTGVILLSVHEIAGMVGFAVAGIAYVWLFIEMGFWRGTSGSNDFGADPIEDEDEIGNLPPPPDAV